MHNITTISTTQIPYLSLDEYAPEQGEVDGRQVSQCTYSSLVYDGHHVEILDQLLIPLHVGQENKPSVRVVKYHVILLRFLVENVVNPLHENEGCVEGRFNCSDVVHKFGGILDTRKRVLELHIK